MRPPLPIMATAVVALLALAVLAVAWIANQRAPAPAQPQRECPAFTLSDPDGRSITQEDLRGSVALVYFGYTFCPDVCPTELAWMVRVLRALGPAGERVRPVFVSVDPERDTPAKLRDYAQLFHPRLLALTGTPEQVAAAAKAFGVIYRKTTPVSSRPGFYLIDHSMSTSVLDRDGGIVRRIASQDLSPADAADLLRPLIGATP